MFSNCYHACVYNPTLLCLKRSQHVYISEEIETVSDMAFAILLLVNRNNKSLHNLPAVWRTVAKAISRWLPTAAARVRAWVWQVEFVVHKMVSRHVFSEYFGFPWKKKQNIPLTSPSSQSPRAVSRGLVTTWSPVQGVQPTVLDLVTEMKRKVSWRRPRPKIGL
jgi:hypothetical protein